LLVVSAVTASGTLSGVAGPDWGLGFPQLTRLWARTVKRYAVAFCSPEMVHGEAGQVCFPLP